MEILGMNWAKPSKAVIADEVIADEVVVDEVVTDAVEPFKLFNKIYKAIEAILKEKNNVSEMIEKCTEGMSDAEEEEYFTLFEKVLIYLKVPKSAYDTIFDDDDEISNAELEVLQELIEDAIGDKDLYEFVYNAVFNEDLPTQDDIDMDNINMDWAWYKSEAECKKGAGDRKVPKSDKQVCKKGYNNTFSGFWRYPKGDFPNGVYKRKDSGSRQKGKKIDAFKGTKPHDKAAQKIRDIDMKRRASKGMTVFGKQPSKKEVGA